MWCFHARAGEAIKKGEQRSQSSNNVLLFQCTTGKIKHNLNIRYIQDTQITTHPILRRPCGSGQQHRLTSTQKSVAGPRARVRDVTPQTFLMRFVGVCCERLNAFDLRSRVRICILVRAVKRAFIISNVIRSVTSHYATSPAQLSHPSCPHFRTFSAALFLPLLYLCMPPNSPGDKCWIKR